MTALDIGLEKFRAAWKVFRGGTVSPRGAGLSRGARDGVPAPRGEQPLARGIAVGAHGMAFAARGVVPV